jgi:hypothetical protein
MTGWLHDSRLGSVAKGGCCREKERQGIKMAACMRVLMFLAAKDVGTLVHDEAWFPSCWLCG